MTYIIVVALLIFSALFSGLNLGLLGLDIYDLERKMKLGNKYATRIYPLRKRGNLLLTALLLGNVAVNAIMAIFLAEISTGIIAGFMTTALIFVFGEIIPQAVISRYALKFGAATAPLVWLLIYLTYPICAPIAYVLDWMLGSEIPTVYTKRELIAIVSEHEDSQESTLDRDEERIVGGALRFSDKMVHDVMTPRTVVEGVEEGQVLNKKLINHIKKTGYSRFPVFEKDEERVLGVVHVRDLLGAKEQPIEKLMYDAHEVDEQMYLDDVLNDFLKLKQHLFIVKDEFGGFSGVVSLEDVIEEILQAEIMDEDDQVADLRKLARQKARGEVK